MQIICIWCSWCQWHPIIFCFIKIQNGFTFLVLAYPGKRGQLTGVCLSAMYRKLDGQHKGSIVLSPSSRVADKEGIRPVGDYLVSQFFLFASVIFQCWFGDTKSMSEVKSLCDLYPKVLFWNKWMQRTKGELILVYMKKWLSKQRWFGGGYL